MQHLLLLSLLANQAAPSVRVTPDSVRPGGAFVVRVRGIPSDGDARAPAGRVGKDELHFYRIRGGWAAIGAAAVGQSGALTASVDLPDGKAGAIEQSVDVRSFSFPTVHLEVDPIYVEPPADMQGRIRDDQRAIAQALAKGEGSPLWHNRFRWPTKRRITSRFGEHRVFNGVKTSRHLGTDLEAVMGAKVGAANDGEVVLARDCFFTGKTVVIRHGAGIFTAYFHLSQIDVDVGDRVKQSHVIGRAGDTGRTTGPHVHYAIRAGRHWADPEAFMSLDLPRPLPSTEPRG